MHLRVCMRATTRYLAMVLRMRRPRSSCPSRQVEMKRQQESGHGIALYCSHHLHPQLWFIRVIQFWHQCDEYTRTETQIYTIFGILRLCILTLPRWWRHRSRARRWRVWGLRRSDSGSRYSRILSERYLSCEKDQEQTDKCVSIYKYLGHLLLIREEVSVGDGEGGVEEDVQQEVAPHHLVDEKIFWTCKKYLNCYTSPCRCSPSRWTAASRTPRTQRQTLPVLWYKERLIQVWFTFNWSRSN